MNSFEMLEKEVRKKVDLFDNSQKRIVRELEFIKTGNTAPMFLTLQKMVKTAKSAGGVISIRPGIASSYIAYLLEITDINPISEKRNIPPTITVPYPTYISEIIFEANEIPCEAFFGKDGQRVPDISVFASADLKKEFIKIINEHNINVLSEAGISEKEFIIKEKDFKDLLYVQAKKLSDDAVIFSKYEDTDIAYDMDMKLYNGRKLLGELQKITEVMADGIPDGDEATLSLFANGNTKAIPEFNTVRVIDILKKTEPKSIADLTKVWGLANGTDLWENNAEIIIENSKRKLKDFISCREDIMLLLTNKDRSKNKAFELSEKIGRGMPLDDKEAQDISRCINLWKFNSLKKIKYAFPKAICVSHTIVAYRIAYYKANYNNDFNKVINIRQRKFARKGD